MEKIGTQKLNEKIHNNNVTIIDARDINAYNGWKLAGEARGGHIKGARSLPYKWADKSYWKDVLDSKEIDIDNSLIVYGYNEGESRKVAEKLAESGFEDIEIYDAFIEEWSDDKSFPMERMQRFQSLVPPLWVKSLLATERPQEYKNDRFVICHSHYRNPDDYELGHIPGAIALDTLALEEPEMWNRRTPEEIKETLEAHGITYDTTVILYGRYSNPDNSDPFPGSSAGHIGAIRNAIIMMYAGVRDIRIINGGLMAWESEGYPLSRQKNDPIPVPGFGMKIPMKPNIMVDMEEAKVLLKSPKGELVSIRSWKEFIGEVSGYNYIDIKGRIPGAIFGNCGSDAYHMENFRNPDHTTREYGEIEKDWLEKRITPDKRIAFYCGTGWRASEAFFNAYLLGWNDIAVFDGGWMEWSNEPSNQIETGIPE
ncbi:MAG: sulfurtransferase [Candidatus Zixiibacteriota bacterium]